MYISLPWGVWVWGRDDWGWDGKWKDGMRGKVLPGVLVVFSPEDQDAAVNNVLREDALWFQGVISYSGDRG